MRIDLSNSIFSKLAKMNQRTAHNQRFIDRLGSEDIASKLSKITSKKIDEFVASHETSTQSYKAPYQNSTAYQAVPETMPEETALQVTAQGAIELEITPPDRKVLDFADIIKGAPITKGKFSAFNNMVNGHYFSSLNNAKLADDGNNLLNPFTSEALNKTWQLSNELHNVNIRNNEGGFSNRDLHGNLAALANSYDIMYKDLTQDNNGQTHFLDEAMRSHLYFNAQQSTFFAVKYEDYSDEASYIADRDKLLEENIRKADEFADVFLKNYKKHGMDAMNMAFEAIDK